MRYEGSSTIGGVSLSLWLDAFTHCHEATGEGVTRLCWPDGGCYLDQENMVVEMFSIIREQLTKAQESKKK